MPLNFAEFCKSLPRNESANNTNRTAPILLGSLVLFILAFSLWVDWKFAISLALVVLLHEAGHFGAMLWFGYQDVRMFFIPFFGGLVTGKKHAAPAWQEAVMILAGPLPGIFLAFAIAWFLPREMTFKADQPLPWQSITLIDLVGILLFLNAFNLLPIFPLDGGRLLQLLLFTRAPKIWLSFLAGSLSVLVIAATIYRLWLFGLVGLIGLVALPFTIREHRLTMAVRRRTGRWTSPLESLSRKECRWLYWMARRVDPSETGVNELAEKARSLHSDLSRPEMSLHASLDVTLAYAAGWIAAIIASGRMPTIHVVG